MLCKSLFAAECALLGLLTGLFGISLPVLAQSAPAFAHQEDFQTNLVTNRIAKWSGDRLVVVDYDGTNLPVIRTIDREGRYEAIALEIPGASNIHVFDYAAGFDGAIAAVGYALSADSQIGHYLVWISPDRKRRTVIRLSPYVAYVVTIARDGTIWTIGGVRTDNLDRSKAQGDVLKRFDSSGKLLASSFPNGRARANMAPGASMVSYLFASPDRVGWFTNGNQLIEFALDGRELVSCF